MRKNKIIVSLYYYITKQHLMKKLSITYFIKWRKFPHEDYLISLPGVENPEGEKREGNPFLELAGQPKTWLLPTGETTVRNSTAENYIRTLLPNGDDIPAEEFGWIFIKA